MADDGVRARRRLRHLRVQLLLELPAVPGRHRAGPRRGRPGRSPDRQDQALLQPSRLHRALRGACGRSAGHAARRGARGRPPGVHRAQHPAGDGGGQRAAGGGRRYVAELTEAARLVAERTGVAAHPWSLAYQSRSGPPSQPWLEPDVRDHLGELAKSGTGAVVVIPVGFVSDHMEVRHDLDVEAAQSAESLGLAFVRAATPGTRPRFASMITELVPERLANARPARSRARLSADCCRSAWASPGPDLPGRLLRRDQVTDPAELLRLAVDAAGEAGRLLASWRGEQRPEVIDTKSSPTDVVTEMDRRSEALITERIRAERPGDTVLGEEGGQTLGGAGRAGAPPAAWAGALGGRPAGRDRQLPVRPARLGRVHRRRGRRRDRRWGGGGAPLRREVHGGGWPGCLAAPGWDGRRAALHVGRAARPGAGRNRVRVRFATPRRSRAR